jgi:hypothetical protein
MRFDRILLVLNLNSYSGILARNILLPLLVLSQSWSSNSGKNFLYSKYLSFVNKHREMYHTCIFLLSILDIIEKAITLLQNPNDESEEKNLKSFSLFDQIKADDFNEIAVNFNTWHTKNPTVINLNDTSSILLLIMMVFFYYIRLFNVKV